MMRDPHLDRINPDGHYEVGNVQFLEGVQNLDRRRVGEREPGEDG